MRKHSQKNTALLLAAIVISVVATTTFNSRPIIGQPSTQQKQDLSQDRVGRMIIGGQLDPSPTLTAQQANLKLHNS